MPVSLFSHASKVLTKIIHRRMQSKIEGRVGENQFGFKKSRGTKKAILFFKLVF